MIFQPKPVSLSSRYTLSLCFGGWGPTLTMVRLFSVCAVCFAASFAAIAAPAQAAHLRARYAPPVVYALPVEPLCFWCIRDAIYADTKLIAHLEANPDVDEAFKGPIVLNARADVRYLRRILGPVETITVAPCCYSRKPLYVR